MIHYISGGERSGKSRHAQQLAEELSECPFYIATSRIWDADFQKRVDKHIADRDERWTTIEEEKYISTVISKDTTVVIDCATLWLTNFYVDAEYDIEKAMLLAKKEIASLCEINANIFIISNEIGMGLHATTTSGRKFTELQGYINQHIAKIATTATFMVSGIPLKLK